MNIRASPFKQYTLSGLDASMGPTKQHRPAARRPIASGGVQLQSAACLPCRAAAAESSFSCPHWSQVFNIIGGRFAGTFL